MTETRDVRTDKAAVRDAVVADLAAETESLLNLVKTLPLDGWDLSTPAEGWSIRDQITHLAYFDDATLLAIDDSAAFARQREALLGLGPAFPDAVAAVFRGKSGDDCLTWFETSRARLLDEYRVAAPSARLPWFGPDMGVASSATARLMETWAHGQDIADALGIDRTPTARLRHVADIGVRTFGFAFQLRGRTVPDVPLRVELTAPDGSTWAWGPDTAGEFVRGSALDFCLVVTQRRNVADTGLKVSGDTAESWIAIAQAYAGAPANGRPAGMFAGEPR